MLIAEIKKELLERFGLDLPISGGIGDSVDNPIVVLETEEFDYIETEYTYLENWCILQEKDYKFIKQALIEKGDKRIDRMTIETDEEKGTLEDFYFDITEGFYKNDGDDIFSLFKIK